MISVVAALLIGVLSLSINGATIDVPVQFVAERHIFGDAYEVNHFSAHLCGGCMFDKQLAIVSLNLQKQPWNETLQDILKATVTDYHGTLITTNNANGSYEETFSFLYHSSFGDLNIKVENGAGSGMIYTIALKFQRSGVSDVQQMCQKRHLMNVLERRAFVKYHDVAKLKSEQLHELVPIFKMSTPYSIRSSDLLFLQLDYCFPHSGNYNLTVSVIANDEESAFATYACPKSTKECKTSNAPFHDTSGSAANTVNVKIADRPDFGPVTVIVRGDGRYRKLNTFTLAASKYSES